MRTIGRVARGVSRRLQTAVNQVPWLADYLPYRHHDYSQQQWELEYSAGHWSYLAELAQLAHYSVIAGYCDFFQRDASILDLCCGEGVLQRRLASLGYARYLGVDVSAEAVATAMQHADERTSFQQADVFTFSTAERFDLLIFNECLYYFADPVELIRRSAVFLNTGGHCIVSMYDTHSTRRLWRLLDRTFRPLDEVRVENCLGKAHAIRAYTASRLVGLEG